MALTQVIARRFEGVLVGVQQSFDNLREAVRELQVARQSTGKLIKDVDLADATDTVIQHGLGRAAVLVVSPPRGASTSGRIEETRSDAYDRSKVSVLQANGYGATVTVDVWVY